VPFNGDVNPYGTAVIGSSTGRLHAAASSARPAWASVDKTGPAEMARSGFALFVKLTQPSYVDMQI
jgi:hypothetical protein